MRRKTNESITCGDSKQEDQMQRVGTSLWTSNAFEAFETSPPMEKIESFHEIFH